MSIEIIARGSSFTDNGYGTLLAFVDDPDDPRRILMLDYANDPDEQDIRLGLAGVHIDTGEIGISGYDLIEEIVRTDLGLLVRLKAGAGQDMAVRFEGETIDGIPVPEIIDRFHRRLQAR